MGNKILLQDQWSRKGNLYARGYIFGPDGQLYSGTGLVGYFAGIKSYTDFEEKVIYANGCFSVIYNEGVNLYAASDSIRAFPLFYKREEEGWIISDDPYIFIKDDKNAELNKIAAIEFLATGFVTGDETLIQGIRQIQAGEIIRIEATELNKKFFFSYRTALSSDSEYNEFRLKGVEIFNEAFRRFISGLNGRTVVVPLSGGFDSRLIVAMLKKNNYEKVICFTYGRQGNPEIEVSRKAAEILRYQWIYIEYTHELISNYLHDEIFKKYYTYAGKLVSMFFMQEYFAVKYLKENKLIPDDSIFAPGHSGDFLGGSQLFKHGNLGLFENSKELSKRIYKVKYCYLRPGPGNKEMVLGRIQKSLEEKFTWNADLSYSIHEDWDFKEKLAKFNFNSSAIYTYFGYEFRFPFWDRELIIFFKNLPLHVKINKYLYDDILCEEFFEPLDLNFEHELQPSETEVKRQRYKNQIKYFLPEFVKRLFMTRADNLFYKEITQDMVDDLALKGKRIRIHGNFYNSLIIQWYLEDTMERLGNR
jgi:asparagine synthase (glutamine-hydrolysing)